MCGISLVSFGNDPMARVRDCRQLVRLQCHRGPDETHVVDTSWFSAGHNRLRILGQGQSGRQPLVDSESRFVGLFNGEIYNYRELAQENGLGFVHSDSDVLLPLWQRFGSSVFSMLDGMYAIAVVDNLEGSVTIGVDPWGIKPLHWTRSSSYLMVASEALALAKTRALTKVRVNSIRHFLHFGNLNAADSGVSGISRMAPGSWIRFSAQGIEETGCVDLRKSSGVLKASEMSAYEHFADSVARQLASDEPVCVCLSGGIDSALLAREVSRITSDVTAVSLSGLGSDTEVKQARRTASHLGIRHLIVPATFNEAVFSRFLQAIERPTIEGLNTFLLANALSSLGYRVGLTGVGADELINGYVSGFRSRAVFWASRMGFSRIWGVMPISARWRFHSPSVRGGSDSGRIFVSLMRQIWSHQDIEAMMGHSDYGYEPPSRSLRTNSSSHAHRIRHAQLEQYLQGRLLPDLDNFSMRMGVELRVPFLGSDLVSTLLESPWVGTKREFASLAQDEFIQQQARQKKRGFDLPMSAWQRETFVMDRDPRSSPESLLWNYLDPMARPLKGSLSWAQVQCLIVLESWLRNVTGIYR